MLFGIVIVNLLRLPVSLGETPTLLLNPQIIRNPEDAAHTMGAYVDKVLVAF